MTLLGSRYGTPRISIHTETASYRRTVPDVYCLVVHQVVLNGVCDKRLLGKASTYIRGRFPICRVDQASLAKREGERRWSCEAQVMNPPVCASRRLSLHGVMEQSPGFRMARCAATILTSSATRSLRIGRQSSGRPGIGLDATPHAPYEMGLVSVAY